MTTIVTHCSLFHVWGDLSTRKNYVYQQVTRDVLRGCEGVINIVDDLVIHGKGIEQHDERLFVVLNIIG